MFNLFGIQTEILMMELVYLDIIKKLHITNAKVDFLKLKVLECPIQFASITPIT